MRVLCKDMYHRWASQVVLVVKNPAANAGDYNRGEFKPWIGKISWGGHGNWLQYSCLENLLDRGAWQAIVHRVTQRWTQLKWLSMHTHVQEDLGKHRNVGQSGTPRKLQMVPLIKEKVPKLGETAQTRRALKESRAKRGEAWVLLGKEVS